MPIDAIWILVSVVAGFMVGFSKTALPGTGIIVVPLMAHLFGARLSVGATLPMLLVGDIIAVASYRKSADWGRLFGLIPWVIPGLFAGATFLYWSGHLRHANSILNPVVGAMVLLMLLLTLLRKKLGNRLLPTSKTGTAATGMAAGFTTMASNAAGPIMAIYLTAANLDKARFMGTTAWHYLIFNLAKAPFLIWLTLDNKAQPMFNATTISFDLAICPVIIGGALVGRVLLPKLSQANFTHAVLVLSAVAAVKLILTP